MDAEISSEDSQRMKIGVVEPDETGGDTCLSFASEHWMDFSSRVIDQAA